MSAIRCGLKWHVDWKPVFARGIPSPEWVIPEALAHGLQREVEAEGVETIAHGIPLIACVCNIVQGYGIAKPMPADIFLDWLGNWKIPAEWQPAVRTGK